MRIGGDKVLTVNFFQVIKQTRIWADGAGGNTARMGSVIFYCSFLLDREFLKAGACKNKM